MSYSEYKQDLWVNSQLNKTDGYFVELGARDGIKTSNTLFLEQKYNWRGILVECSPSNYKKLQKNRKNCIVDNHIIYSASNKNINFYPGISSGLGSINFNSKYTKKQKLQLNTITISDLLNKYNAPNIIDYISLDIEGAELEALKGFKWDYKVKLWTIECGNYDSTRREKIRKIMYNQGYLLFSQNICSIEDWWYLE